MSGAGGDSRWRQRPGQQQSSQTQTQTQSQSSSRERPNRQSVSGNVWTQREATTKGKAGVPQQQQQQPRSAQQSAAASPNLAPQEQHVPVKGYNAAEAKQYLKKSYQDAVNAAGGDEKKLIWKPEGAAAAPKNAWGQRADKMAGGRDFWTLLRREVNNAEQSKERSKSEQSKPAGG